MSNLRSNPQKRLHQWVWWAMAIIILLTIVVRVRLLDVPLERDEGEYAYMAQLMLQGVPPYEAAYSMKMPGIYAVYALILAVFGQTNIAIHLGLLISNIATILLLFFIGRKLMSPLAGVTASAAYAMLSMGRPVQGIFANAEHFAVIPALGALLLLISLDGKERKGKVFLSGILVGVGFIIKQHAAILGACALFYLAYDLIRGRIALPKGIYTAALFGIGAILPFALVCLFFASIGLFDKFWFWTVSYANQYISIVPFVVARNIFTARVSDIISAAPALWGLVSLGVVALFIDKRLSAQRLFIAVFAAFSFLAVCPGLYFREHYFIFLLPAVSLLAGAAIYWLDGIQNMQGGAARRRLILLLLLAVIMSHSIFTQRFFLIKASPEIATKMAYGGNPFLESRKIAEYIERHTEKTDSIAVIGSEPQIYFYSKRRSVTPYIYMYPLMEVHGYAQDMQKEMIRDIESAEPAYLVFVDIATSWLPRQGSERLVFDWFDGYNNEYYDMVGVVEISPFQPTRYYWNDVTGYEPGAKGWYVTIHRRKGI